MDAGETEAMSTVSASISAEHLARLRSELLRFAMLQLRDQASAEDAVQDAMLAAMSKMSEFRGQAQWSTWVFAILKKQDHRRHPFPQPFSACAIGGR